MNMFPELGRGVAVTRPQARPFRGVTSDAGGTPVPGQPITRNGPIRTATGTFRLVGGQAKNLAVANNFRAILIVQNLDPAQPLFVNFGAPADATSLRIIPLGNLYMDYRCVTDSVWVFSSVDLSGFFMEAAPTG